MPLSSCHVSGTGFPYDLLLMMLVSVTWLRRCLPRFSVVNLSPLPHFHTLLFRGKSLSAAHTQGRREFQLNLPEGQGIYIRYLEFSHTGACLPLPPSHYSLFLLSPFLLPPSLSSFFFIFFLPFFLLFFPFFLFHLYQNRLMDFKHFLLESNLSYHPLERVFFKIKYIGVT